MPIHRICTDCGKRCYVFGRHCGDKYCQCLDCYEKELLGDFKDGNVPVAARIAAKFLKYIE